MIPILQVDAFTCGPFTGNPAAVCLLEGPASPEWMQNVAMEMNLSETAFLHPIERGEWGLRWFTPKVEVELCGHATLASAHVLFERGLADGEVTFRSASGPLRARAVEDRIELDFPTKRVEVEAPLEGLLPALGLSSCHEAGRAAWDFLIAVEDEDVVRALRPDHGVLRGLPVRGVIVTAPSRGPRYDIVSRFFAPGSGIDEDPVTGSVHCALATYWKERLGKERLEAFQASARGGELMVELRGDRVFLTGRTLTVMVGDWLIPPDTLP